MSRLVHQSIASRPQVGKFDACSRGVSGDASATLKPENARWFPTCPRLTAKRNDVCSSRRCETAHILSPLFESCCPLIEILKPVVDCSHAADRATHVVEYFINDVRG